MQDRLSLTLAARLGSRKDALTSAWVGGTLRSYPAQTARFLRQEADPFRNPVGHALDAGLGAALDELLGDMDAARLTAALEPVIRIRAVQDFTPRQAVGFVFLLKPVLREAGGELAPAEREALDARVDELALLAFDLYLDCRERIHEIRAGELRRRMGVRGGEPGGPDGGNGG